MAGLGGGGGGGLAEPHDAHLFYQDLPLPTFAISPLPIISATKPSENSLTALFNMDIPAGNTHLSCGLSNCFLDR